MEFVIAFEEEAGIGRPIVVTQRHVNEVLPAKASVFARIRILVKPWELMRVP